MKSSDQFGLGFRQIERSTISLSNAASKEKQKSQRLQEYVPETAVLLRIHDVNQAQRARQHQHAHNRKTKRDLVADHMGCGASSAARICTRNRCSSAHSRCQPGSTSPTASARP